MKLIFSNNKGAGVPTIWVLCHQMLSGIAIFSCSDQQVTLEMSFDNSQLAVTLVYAATNQVARRSLWQELYDFSSYSQPWILVGDFNAITGAHERIGGNLPPNTSCTEFSTMIDDCNLSHLDTEGNFLTWANNRASNYNYMEQRLDRALSNIHFYDVWPISKCDVLPRILSDHSPLVISASRVISHGPRPFKFHAVWKEHESFKSMISGCWNSISSNGCPMRTLVMKLKATKSCLKSWNASVFGNVHENVNAARNKLSLIQTNISSFGGSDTLFQEESVAKQEVMEAVRLLTILSDL